MDNMFDIMDPYTSNLTDGVNMTSGANMTDPFYWDYPSDDNMECNITCCTYPDGDDIKVICFDHKNFTDSQALTHTPVWSLCVRWILVVPPLVFLGVLGNLAIIIILIKNRLLMKTSVNQFILNMAVSDLILASTGPITFTIRDTHQFWVLGSTWCHLDGFLQVSVMTVSVLSLTTISVDRYLGILHPMHKHLKSYISILIIVGIWVISCLSAVPFYIYRNYGIRDWADITEVYCDEITDKTSIYWLVVIIVINWLPLTIMIFCYTKLFLEFKKYALKVEGKEHPSILNAKTKSVKMLFTMIIAFAVCWLPFQMFIIYREKLILANHSTVNSDEELYKILFTVTQYLIYVNPAINPFIYGLMHENFKKGFRVTFSCLFKTKPKFVLVQSYGSHAYVWNRQYSWNRQSRFRHTISSTGYKYKRNRDASSSRQTLFVDNAERRINISDVQKGEKRPSTSGSNIHFQISIVADKDKESTVVDIQENKQCSIIVHDERRQIKIVDQLKEGHSLTVDIKENRLGPPGFTNKLSMRRHSPMIGDFGPRPKLRRSSSVSW